MSVWASGDTLTPSTLNRRLASASTTAGFSTNTLSPESGTRIGLTGFLVTQTAGNAGRIVAGGGTEVSTSSGAVFELFGNAFGSGLDGSAQLNVGSAASSAVILARHGTELAVIGSRTTWFAPLASTDTLAISTSRTPTGLGSGATGDIAWDTGFVYVCVSTNSWRRAALSAF